MSLTDRHVPLQHSISRMHYVIQRAINAEGQCWEHQASESQAL